jgi:hypothetical protein
MSGRFLTRLYASITAKLGKEAAENITGYIDNKINSDLENKAQNLATKEDISKVNLRIAEVELKITELELRLSNKIGDSRDDIRKWVFVSWLALALMIMGIYLKG